MRYSIVDVSILNGNTFGEKSIELKKGEVLAVALYKDSAPSKPVNIKIEDERGDTIHDLVSYKHYEPRGGSYLESVMPIDTGGKRDIVIKATSKTAQTADFNFQMVFFIREDHIIS